MFAQRFRRQLRAGLQHQRHRDGLAPLRIRQAEGGALGDGGVLADGSLDLQRMDVLAAGDDQVPGPPGHGVAAVVRTRCQVAGMEPALLVARPLLRPVIRDHIRPAHQQFTDARIHTGQHHFHSGCRPSATAGVAVRSSGRQRDREGAGFGRAVHVAQRHATIEEGPHQRRRQHAGAGPHRPQAGQIDLRPLRMLDQRLHRGRNLQRQRRPVLCQRRQRRIGAEARVQQHAGARVQARQSLDAQSADVEQRQHGQHRVARRDLLQLRRDAHVGQQVGLGVDGGTRPAGGAGGIDQQRGRRRVADGWRVGLACCSHLQRLHVMH